MKSIWKIVIFASLEIKMLACLQEYVYDKK